MRGGIPGDCTIAPVDDPPLAELLKKGERIADAVARFQHRRREVAADLHRVRSSPWPSAMQKEKAKAQIAQWAEAAAPDCDSMIEHNSKLSFPPMTLSSLVRGEKPTLAFTDPIVDAFGVVCWLFRDQMLAKINAAIDEAADDKAALTADQQRHAGYRAQ